jgi:2-amino-4-hydroxy-6-hydroxymethyldihydropteridine diphosphokinase
VATIYLGIGSNVDPVRNLRLAMRELRRRFDVCNQSSVYRGPAVGFVGDEFLNLVVEVKTDASPEEVVRELEEIHRLAGRTRNSSRFCARELDIDLLLYDQLVRSDGCLELPRSDVLHYAFVLVPLAEIAPALVHPENGRCMSEHLSEYMARRGPERQPLTIMNVNL